MPIATVSALAPRRVPSMMDDLLQEMIDPAPVHRDAPRRRRLWTTVAIVGLAAVGATTLTTSAIFTDNDSTSADIETGTVDLAIGRAGALRVHAAEPGARATRRTSPLEVHEQRLARAAVLDLLPGRRSPRTAPRTRTSTRRPSRATCADVLRAARLRGARGAVHRATASAARPAALNAASTVSPWPGTLSAAGRQQRRRAPGAVTARCPVGAAPSGSASGSTSRARPATSTRTPA